MNASRQKALDLLCLPEQAFKDLDAARASQLGTDLCEILATDPARSAPEPEGFLAISAPRKARLDHPWPLLLGYRYSSLRGWEVDFKRNLLLIATDLRNGETFLSFPFLLQAGRRRVPVPEPSRSGPAPQGLSASAHLTDVDLLDLRTALPNATTEPRRLALAVTYLDWSSNVVVSESGEAAPQGSNTTLRRSPFIKPGDIRSDVEETSLTLPREISKSSGLEIKGVLDLRADDIPVIPDGQGAWVSPITLLFLKLDDKDPLRVRAQAPVRALEGRVRGAFSISVDSALPHADLDGSYQVYLAAGAQLAGPYPLTALP